MWYIYNYFYWEISHKCITLFITFIMATAVYVNDSLRLVQSASKVEGAKVGNNTMFVLL